MRLSRLWRQWREQRALGRRAISDPLWQLTLARYPFLGRRSAADLQELRRLSSLFLDRKEFAGAGGLEVSDDIAVAVAAQACLPVLRLGLGGYESFVGIVLHPDAVVAAREVTDDDGVVHRYDEVLSGEAMEGGPVMLSWSDVRDAGDTAEDAYNVVIHEFAHVLDMGDGEADGIPPLGSPALRRQWHAVLSEEYERFCRWTADSRDTVLDPYGAEAPEEFFAVAAEAFFVTPQAFNAQQPAMYRLLANYFQQNPAGEA
jgi:Mlc titration factor MtfA (ptsG expression regulator)